MPNAGAKISISSILNDFNSTVIQAIKQDAYHSGRLPAEGGYQCIPASMLDNINNIQLPNIGTTGSKVDANTIYNNLVQLTANLTRMGTFSWIRRYRSTDRYGVVSYQTRGTLSGKAFFTTAYIRSLNAVGRVDVLPGSRITAQGMNAMMANMITSWRNSSKYHYQYTQEECHSECHSNCHSDCHSDCHGDCYGD